MIYREERIRISLVSKVRGKKIIFYHKRILFSRQKIIYLNENMELIKFQHSNLKKCQIKANSVIIYLTIVLISSQVMITVLSFHIPNHHYRYGPMRRQDDIDSDGDEELDSGASAPYQNQDEGGQGSSDGYEDNEPGK